MTGQGVQEGIEPVLDAAVGARRHRRHVDRGRLPDRPRRRDRRRRAPRAGARRLGRRRARDGSVRVRTAAQRPLLRPGVRLRGARDALAPAARAAAREPRSSRGCSILYVVWPAWDDRLRCPRPSRSAFAATGRASEAVRRRAPAAGRGRARSVVLAVRGRAILRARADLRRPRAGRTRTATCRRPRRVRSFEQQHPPSRPRFYVGPLAQNLTAPTEVELGDLGRTRSLPTRRARRRDRRGPRGDRAVVSADRYAAERRQGESIAAGELEHVWGWSGRAGQDPRRAPRGVPRRARAVSRPACAASSSAAAPASSPSGCVECGLRARRRRPERGDAPRSRASASATAPRSSSGTSRPARDSTGAVRRDRRRERPSPRRPRRVLRAHVPAAATRRPLRVQRAEHREPAGLGRAQHRVPSAALRHVTAARDRVSSRTSSAARFEDAGLEVEVCEPFEFLHPATPTRLIGAVDTARGLARADARYARRRLDRDRRASRRARGR